MIQATILALAMCLMGCASDFKGMSDAASQDFADIPVIPYVPDFALTVTTPTNDRRLSLSPVPASPPDLHMGIGKALIKIKNNTSQAITGTLTIEKASDAFSLTVMQICESDSLKNCVGINALSFAIELAPGQEMFYTLHIEASGSIGFAPVANAVKLVFQGTGDDALTSMTSNLPIINDN